MQFSLSAAQGPISTFVHSVSYLGCFKELASVYVFVPLNARSAVRIVHPAQVSPENVSLWSTFELFESTGC